MNFKMSDFKDLFLQIKKVFCGSTPAASGSTFISVGSGPTTSRCVCVSLGPHGYRRTGPCVLLGLEFRLNRHLQVLRTLRLRSSGPWGWGLQVFRTLRSPGLQDPEAEVSHELSLSLLEHRRSPIRLNAVFSCSSRGLWRRRRPGGWTLARRHLFPNICYSTSVPQHLLINICSPTSVTQQLFLNICSPTSVPQHLFPNICSSTSVPQHLFLNICSHDSFLPACRATRRLSQRVAFCAPHCQFHHCLPRSLFPQCHNAEGAGWWFTVICLQNTIGVFVGQLKEKRDLKRGGGGHCCCFSGFILYE